MTIQETSKIMDLLAAAYPQTWQGKGESGKLKAAALWAEMFIDVPAGLVAAAVKAHIRTCRFPPTISEIVDGIALLTEPADMTELAAWNLVCEAVNGASMELWSRTLLPHEGLSPPSAVRNFETLPDAIRHIVASPKQLADWALIDTDVLQTVVQSNFLRSYRAAVKRERDMARLPDDMRRMTNGKRNTPSRPATTLLSDEMPGYHGER